LVLVIGHHVLAFVAWAFNHAVWWLLVSMVHKLLSLLKPFLCVRPALLPTSVHPPIVVTHACGYILFDATHFIRTVHLYTSRPYIYM